MRIALFGASLNPAHIYHRGIVERLSRMFDKVIVVPCGRRPDKPTVNDINIIDRATMADLTFRGIKNVEIDLSDMERPEYTRTCHLQRLYESLGEIWHVVGADLVVGGSENKSDIQQNWDYGEDIWKNFNWVVVARHGYDLSEADLPPKAITLEAESSASSTDVRRMVFDRESITGLVVPEVASYIERYSLYRGVPPQHTTHFQLEKPRILIVADHFNTQALIEKADLTLGARDDRYVVDEDSPNLIVVLGGDGTMLRAIKAHWRKRVPFLGLNFGHRGFLLNDLKFLRPGDFGKKMVVHHCPLLYVRVRTKSGKEKTAWAFNDAWVVAKPGTTSWVSVEAGGVGHFEKLVGDGVLLATPAGSTAYARAMGATPIPLGTPGLVLVGNNVLEPANWKSAMVSMSSGIWFRNVDPVTPHRRPILGFADGEELGEVEEMLIRVSQTAAVELAFFPSHDVMEKITKIQFGKD